MGRNLLAVRRGEQLTVSGMKREATGTGLWGPGDQLGVPGNAPVTVRQSFSGRGVLRSGLMHYSKTRGVHSRHPIPMSSGNPTRAS